MSSFHVVPGSVAGAGDRLRGVAEQVLTAHSALGSCTGAAAGTPGGDAFEGLMGHWATVLPQFALSGAALSRAISGAAEAYGTTEDGLALAADIEGIR